MVCALAFVQRELKLWARDPNMFDVGGAHLPDQNKDILLVW